MIRVLVEDSLSWRVWGWAGTASPGGTGSPLAEWFSYWWRWGQTCCLLLLPADRKQALIQPGGSGRPSFDTKMIPILCCYGYIKASLMADYSAGTTIKTFLLLLCENMYQSWRHHWSLSQRSSWVSSFASLYRADDPLQRTKHVTAQGKRVWAHPASHVPTSLTLVFGFELPVARAGPRCHGPGAEVGVLSGLRRQLQAHGGDVPLSDGNRVPAPSQHLHSLLLWYQIHLDTFIELHKYNIKSFLFAKWRRLRRHLPARTCENSERLQWIVDVLYRVYRVFPEPEASHPSLCSSAPSSPSPKPSS